MPTNWGDLVTGQSKRLMMREKIRGPAVNTRNPMIQGLMNRYGTGFFTSAFLVALFFLNIALPLSFVSLVVFAFYKDTGGMLPLFSLFFGKECYFAASFRAFSGFSRVLGLKILSKTRFRFSAMMDQSLTMEEDGVYPSLFSSMA